MSRAVLAEAILQQLLEAMGEGLNVSVASASVGPAPAGDILTFLYCSICKLVMLCDSQLGACCSHHGLLAVSS